MEKIAIQILSVVLILFGAANVVFEAMGESIIRMLFCRPPPGITSNCHLQDVVSMPLSFLCIVVGSALLLRMADVDIL